MKKVLVITYYWPPAGGPGVQRWLKLAKYLPEFGIEPIILTVDPNDASFAITDTSLLEETKGIEVHHTRTREIYSFYQKLTGKDSIPVGGGSDDTSKSFIKQLPNFIRGNFFIPDPRMGWKRHAMKKASELIEKYNIDTIVTTSPPHSVQLIGLALKKKHNIKWVADFRDPWTDIYFYNKFLRTKLARKIDAKLESNVLKAADRILTVSENQKKLFEAKVNSKNHYRVINNGFDADDFSNIKTQERDKTKFVITYTGKINSKFVIDALIKALATINSPNIKARFVGSISEDLVRKFEDNHLKNNLELISYVPHEKSIEYLSIADLQLLVIPKVEGNKAIVTSKFYEYLATGSPILAIGPIGGDVDHILASTKAGRIFDYDDAEGITKFISQLISGELRISPNREEIMKYSRQALANKTSQVLFEL